MKPLEGLVSSTKPGKTMSPFKFILDEAFGRLGFLAILNIRPFSIAIPASTSPLGV